MILDCSTRGTALQTVAEIHGVQKDTLQTFFDRWPPDGLQNPAVAPEDRLWRAFRQAFPRVVNWEATVWFHMSRVPSGTTFQEGIQTLGERLESIWASLKELGLQHVTDAQWEHFKNNLGSHHHASLYHLKTPKRRMWGPYAVLVREAAFQSSRLGNHDYLATPEIIEDICLCFRDRFAVDLLQQYQQQTQPCIVSFVAPGGSAHTLRCAVWYSFLGHHGEDMDFAAHPCFDGQGKGIPAEHIVKVEFIPVTPPRPQASSLCCAHGQSKPRTG